MLIKREMALDQDIGLNGALFGGDMMSHMDQTAGITASLVSYNRRFVTRKVSELIFQLRKRCLLIRCHWLRYL